MKRTAGARGLTARTSRTSSRLAVLALGAALGLTACSATNPATIATPYAASDGSNAEITDPATGAVVKLRNFLVVGADKGKPGVLLGAVANEGDQPVELTLTVQTQTDGKVATIGTGKVTAKPGELTQVGPTGTAVPLPSLPSGPGVVVQLNAQSPAGGETINIPVVAAVGAYASISAAPSASAS